MELLGEHLAPRLVELVGIDVGAAGRRRRRPQLGFAQQPLAPAVAELRAQLAGQRPPMGLEVQLAVPHRHGRPRRRLGLDVLEEARRRAELDVGQRIEVGEPGGAGEHLARRPAAAVAIAVGDQRDVAPGVLGEALHRLAELARGDLGAVGVDRWEVREHTAAVDALPPERLVREPVGLVPRQLLGDEPAHPPGGEDLRQASRVAEDVGDPHLRARHTEVLGEPALSVDDLAGDALPRREVHVRFDPHPPDRDPLPGGDLGGDPLEQLRFALADPLVLLGLRAGEHVVGLVVHQGHRRSERAHALAHRLADRPQPRRVDVGVPGGDGAVVRGRSRCRQRRSEDRPGLRRRGPDGDGVEPAGEQAQQPRPTSIGDGQRAHHRVEDVEVVQQGLRLLVDDDEVGAGELVQRGLACGGRRTERRRPELRERRVRGCLDDDLHRARPSGDRHGGAPRVDALDWLSVRPTNEALALESGGVGDEAEVDDRLDTAPSPLGRHVAPAAEPRRAPRWPPWRGHREWPQGVERGSRVDAHCQPPRVDQRKDALEQLARDALLDQRTVVVHAGTVAIPK